MGCKVLWNCVQTKNTVIKWKGETMASFDEDLFQKGLEQRKATLGAE